MVLHIRAPTDGDTGIASEFLFVGGDAAAVHTQLQLLHNGRAALAHAASLSADCGAAAAEAAPTELTASPAIGDQLGCAVIIGAAKC